MSGNASTASRPRRLSGGARKKLLLLHILSAAAWFGIDLTLGILVFTALLTDDPQTAATSLQVLELFAIWPMFAASIACLASGILLGLGSKYGLVRYWWVAVKLAINVLMSTLIVVALRPGIGDAAGIGERLATGDPTASVPTDLLFPVLVAPALLLIAYLLSVFKPPARIRRRKSTTALTPVAAEPLRETRTTRPPVGV